MTSGSRLPGGTADRRSSWPAGWHVQVVDETGSTNADLMAAAAAGAPDRSVLAARHQTAGRGRLDRRWDAPPGVNLLVSLLLREVPEHPVHLTWRVALAARAAVAQLTGRTSTLKWPNDLLLEDHKLAGVLAQAGGVGGIEYVVVGIGVNVAWGIEGAATLDGGCAPEELLASLLVAFDELPSGETELLGAYRSASATIGAIVRVELPGLRTVEGRVLDVDIDGRVVVLDDCAITHRFDVGDVVHLRPA